MKRKKWIIASAMIILTIVVFLAVLTGRIPVFGLFVQNRDTGSIKIDEQKIMKHIQFLSSDEEFLELQYRVAGSDGERKAADYIAASFSEYGLDVEEQTFEFDEVLKETRKLVKFTVNGRVIHPTSIEVLSNGNVSTTFQEGLIDLGKGTKEDFEVNADRIKGKFVLMKADETTSAEWFTATKLNRGVKGFIVYAPEFVAPDEPGVANRFILPEPRDESVMTVTTISREDYEYLTGYLSEKQDVVLEENIMYEAVKNRRSSQNVIVTLHGKDGRNSQSTPGNTIPANTTPGNTTQGNSTPGNTTPGNTTQGNSTQANKTPGDIMAGGTAEERPLVYIAAHYDSINSPGANDNASGTAALIELAGALAGMEFSCDIRFVAFGAEEIGLFGSKYFISELSREDLKRSRFMINLDGPGIGQIFIIGKCLGEAGDSIAVGNACKSARDHSIQFKKLEFPDSDQFFFHQAGVPTVTFGSMVDARKLRIPWPNLSDSDYHIFGELLKERVVMPEGDHTLNDTFERILESDKRNGNFNKLALIVSGVLEEFAVRIVY